MFDKNKNIIPHVIFGSKVKKRLFEKDVDIVRQTPNSVGKSAEYALTAQSYPLVVSGEAGSGRQQLILDLAVNNIKHKSPFVFVSGTGDVSAFWKLYSAAEQFDSTDNFYIINIFQGKHGKTTHTFDPLNSLIGNNGAFDVIFGAPIGQMIHALCLCKKDAGQKVTMKDLSHYINLEWLRNLPADETYSEAKGDVQKYLDFIKHLDPSEEHGHFFHTLKAIEFRATFENSGCYSTEPEIDFDEIYKQNKYLYVMLPALEKDPDAFNMYAVTVLLLLEQSRAHQKLSEFPTEFVHDTIAVNDDVEFFVESFKSAQTVYSINSYEQSKRLTYRSHNRVAEKSNSFLMLRADAMLPESTAEILSKKANMNKVPVLSNYFDSEGIAFGHIAKISHGQYKGTIKEEVRLICNPVDVVSSTETRLSRVSLMN
jgi:hypothetical protein